MDKVLKMNKLFRRIESVEFIYLEFISPQSKTPLELDYLCEIYQIT